MTEPERTVQVPVSLIERARQFIIDGFKGKVVEDIEPLIDDLADVLSQPTPTAEPCKRCGGARFIDTGRTSGNYSVGTPCPSCNAEPPSIAELDRVALDIENGIDPSTIRDVTPPTESTK